MKLYEKIKDNVYIIAEMSANHGGSLETALRIVDEAAKAGADCLKIQTYTADTLTIDCDKEDFLIHGGLWDGYNYYRLYQEGMLPWEWQGKIKERCEALGMDFLSTPFDRSSVDFLETLGAEAYKIASYELIDLPLIRYAAGKKKPMILSCGMATLEEITEAIAACREVGNEQIVLLKCCSQYPAEYQNMNVATIPDMRERFALPVGLSDHSEGSLAPVIAVSLGATVIEKHICLDDNESVDAGFSMNVHDFADMVRDVRNAVLIKGKATYERTAAEEKGSVMRRSLYAVRPIAAGEVFSEDNVRSIRPAHGLPPKYYDALLGKTAKRAYDFGDPISKEEIEK